MSIAGESATTPVTMLTTTGNNWNPIFVGNKIAFVSWRNGDISQIYDMNADGTNTLRLTTSDLEDLFNPGED